MSHVVSVKRVLAKPEVLALVAADSSLGIVREDADTLDIVWSDGAEDSFFQLVGGELQAVTPSTAAANKLAEIAKSLGASVVGEEDLVPVPDTLRPGIFAGRSTWVGWPLMVLILAGLLVWRW